MKRKKALVAEDNDEHFKMFKSYLKEMKPTGSDLIATVVFPCHSGATLSIRRLPHSKARCATRLIKRCHRFGRFILQRLMPNSISIINSRYCGNLLW